MYVRCLRIHKRANQGYFPCPSLASRLIEIAFEQQVWFPIIVPFVVSVHMQ